MLDKKELANFLRALAKKIEEGEVSLEGKKQINKAPIEVNGLFDGAINEEKIREQLASLDIADLKSVVQMHSMDPKSTVRKWKDKDKIIDFILERRKGLINRFKGF